MNPTLFVLLALAAVLAGCASPTTEITPVGQTRVAISSDDPFIEIHTRPIYELTLTLPPPNVPGYVWEIAAADPRYLKQTSTVAPLPGGSGGATVTFVTLRTGRTRLRFFAIPRTPARVADPGGKCDIVVLIE
ncbi:MAG: hypothetical protein Q7S40_33290 [Opitutaceae bacterium]|nr:hypothetical protein [Opitutaceae bacterium]